MKQLQKHIKKSPVPTWAFFLFLWCLGASASATGIPSVKHEFHVSVMRVDYNAANQSLEISLKVFTDDIEKSLEGMGAEKLRLGSPREFAASDSILAAYLNHRISFSVNDEKMDFSFVGREVELDNTTWCYLEVTSVPILKQLSVRNKVLFELFEDQTNLVNVFVGEFKKSLLLRSAQPEDSLTFE